MFFELGWKTAFRNFQRSMLAVVSIAFATMTIITVVFLSTGVPGGAFSTERQFLGGDILIVPYRVAWDDLTAPSRAHWSYRVWDLDRPGILPLFVPQIASDGVFVSANSSAAAQTMRQRRHSLLSVKEELEQMEDVKYAYPHLTLPVLVERKQNTNDDGAKRYLAWLRARKTELDAEQSWEDSLLAGRYLSRADEGKMVALVDGYRPSFTHPDDSRYGYDRFNGQWLVWNNGRPIIAPVDPPPVGGEMTVVLPRIDAAPQDDGEMVFHHGQGEEVELEVIGHFGFQTAEFQWSTNRLTLGGFEKVSRMDRDHPRHYATEPLYWSTTQIFVPEKTFQELFERNQAKPSTDATLPPTELVVKVNDYSRVEEIAQRLQAAYPEYTVLSVPRLASMGDIMPEPMVMTPPEDARGTQMGRGDLGLSGFRVGSWLTDVMGTLAVLMGGLLFAGNIYILLVTRRQQLAMLKAMGSRRHQILVSVLAEMAIIATAGAFFGLLGMSPMLLWQWLSNDLTPVMILSKVANALGLVMALVVVSALVFGGIPALWAINRPVREVFKSG